MSSRRKKRSGKESPVNTRVVGLTILLFTDLMAPEIWGIFPTLLILYSVIIIALILVILGAGPSPNDLYEEKHGRVRELKAEQEFIQNKIKRIEDAQ